MQLTRGHIAFVVACFVAGVLVGAGLRSCSKPTNEPSVTTVLHDTLTIRDTVRIAGKTIVRSVVEYDTAIVFLRDTVRDTLVVHLPIEHKEYRDTFATDSSRIELDVLFQGYRARIDSVGINYQLTPKVRTEVKRRGWGQFVGIGVGVGYGASVVNQRVYAAPEVGVHVTYGWGYHW